MSLKFTQDSPATVKKAAEEVRRNSALEAFLVGRKAKADYTALNLALTTFQTSTTLALAGKEPTIAAGTAGQYWRGDKTWQIIAINDVNGLSSSLSGLSTAAAAKLAIPTIQTISTNAAATVTPTTTNTVVFHTGTLTADRTITLSTSGQTAGSMIRFVRTGSGAFNLSIGGLKSLATATWCVVIFNGTAWQLVAYGTL